MSARTWLDSIRLAGLAMLLLASGVAVALARPEKVAGGIRFTYSAPDAGSVAWAGEFNSWSTSAHPMSKGGDGTWSVVLPLPAGTHAYKFVVDGQWMADPENGVTAGEFGNSVITVGADGGLAVAAATSNTAYSPKILVGGRMIALHQSILNPAYSRYELTRPEMDIDLGFDIRFSDVLTGRFLMNLNPREEDVQDYRSRLNFKRGSLLLQQPDLKVLAFDSENIGTWDGPLALVGDVGQFHRPYGYQRTGFQLSTPRFGIQTEVLYTDHFRTGGTEYPGFDLNRGSGRQFVFEADPDARAVSQLLTQRSGSGYALTPGQSSKVQSTDIGDDDRSFGYGDGDEDMFAMRMRRDLGPWRVGVMGRTDRGFQLGQLALAQPTSDSTLSLWRGQTTNEWFAVGGDVQWTISPSARMHGALLTGARRMTLVNGSTRSDWKATSIQATSVSATRGASASADGTHFTTDRSWRMALGGAWTLAQGDIGLRADVEHQRHRYPSWTQPPTAPPGVPNADHPRFENVDFQRGVTVGDDLDNSMTEFRLGWDRDWRYYLGRRVKTTLDVVWTQFEYDPRTAWEYQLWFPTGNFWLESGQHQVSVNRLTLLGRSDVVAVRPSVQVPLRLANDMRFAVMGDYSGVNLGTQPLYAETIVQFGFDPSKPLRLQTDWRWVKYDAPSLGLTRGYVSQFTEAIYRFGGGIEVSLGFGVDPYVLDRDLNDFARIGRERFLNERNATGFIAENDWLSLAPQISAAEKRLQNEKRIQLEAIVRF